MMIFCLANDTNPGTYIKLMEELQKINCMFHLSIEENKLIIFDQKTSAGKIFTVVNNICTITAVMNDTVEKFPFNYSDNNAKFSYIIQLLQSLEIEDPYSTRRMLEYINMFVAHLYKLFCNTGQLEVDDGISSTTEIAKKLLPRIDRFLEMRFLLTKQLSTPSTRFLYEHCEYAINQFISSPEEDIEIKIRQFLENMNLPVEDWLISMFYAVSDINTISYNTIAESDTFKSEMESRQGKTMSVYELRQKSASIFDSWSERHKIQEYTNANNLSIIDILQIYNTFINCKKE